MNNNYCNYLIVFLMLGLYSSQSSCKKEPVKYNVIFIAVDDMNNWVGEWRGIAKTPNIDILSDEGISFKNAHCVAPACNPSRASLFTGLRPESTGVYGNTGNFRDKKGGKAIVTLPQFLRAKGYETIAAGKLFHAPRGTKEEPSPQSDPMSWDFQLKTAIGTPGADMYLNENGRSKWLNGEVEYDGLEIADYLQRTGIWGSIPYSKEECGDWNIAKFGAEYLQKDHNKPFFLALGIFRPHAPQLAPKEYFDMFPLEMVKLPQIPEHDLDDIPDRAKSNWSTGFARKIRSDSTQWKKAIQGYLASCSFADDCVGEILNALKNSKYKDNTIVVFWTDHGWQLGHKDRWEKQTLWNQSTHAPMIIKTPQQVHESSITEHVSLLDIYPTVIELLGYKVPDELEGHSLVQLLESPKTKWMHKTVVTDYNSYSVLWKNWNYIRYPDGSEELYDHSTDPNEWNNIAGLPESNKIIEELKNAIPVRN